MAGNIKGITIEFRGDTTNLSKAINTIRSEAKDLDKELGYIDKALKFNPKNVDLIKQKITLLKDATGNGKKNIEEMKKALDDMKASGVDRTSAEYRELEREIAIAEGKQKQFNKELRKLEALATPLGQLGSKLKSIGDKMTAVGKTMTTKITAPIVAGYTVASKYASDYEENLNKIDVAFGENAQAVIEWSNTARTQFGLSKVQATDVASSFGALGKGIGLSSEEASELSTSLAGLSADLGSYFNASVDDSAKALEGIFTGEAEALKKFGVVMNETNLKKFADEQGLVYKELSQTEKTMLRYNYVMSMTKDAQGDFSRTSDGTANTIKIFKASLQDLATAVGSNLLPIITPIVQKITELVNKFNELSPQTQKIITIIGLVVGAIGPLLLIIGGFASAIGSIMSLMSVLQVAIAGLSASFLPIVGIIAGVIAVGVLLYKNWDTIKEKAIEVKDWVVKQWTTLKTKVEGLVIQLKTKVLMLWQNIKDGIKQIAIDVYIWTIQKFLAIKNGVTTAFNTLKTTVTNVWNGIKTAITHPVETAVSVVKKAIDKIKSFFSNLSLKLPHIKLPHFKLTGSFSLTPPSVPKLSIDWYKQGAIFMKPTIFGNGVGVGDAIGGEAVLPLRKLWEEMDKRYSQGVTININAPAGMDVNELAEKVSQKLIQAQKRRSQAWA